MDGFKYRAPDIKKSTLFKKDFDYKHIVFIERYTLNIN
jgi:hypothetical protein